MEYDLVGNLKKTTDAKGSIITNSYDKTGRVTKRTYSNEPQGVTTPNVEYFYDGKGLTTPQTPNYAKGKLTKVTSSISETRYTNFDNFGRLLQMEQRTPFTDTETIATATPRVSSYQYDFGGRLVAETYPSGRVVKNEFNIDGDLSRVASKANATATERLYANSFSFTASGGIEKMRLGNSKFETAKFNSRNQATEFGLGHSATDASLWKINLEYGELENGSVNINKNAGNIARQTLSFAGLTTPIVQSYKYDSLDRLTEAKETLGASANAPENWNQTWNYDRFGNRIAFSQNVNGQQLAINSATLPSVNPNSNRFNLGQGFAYDKNGNIVSDTVNNGRSFEFDAENKQTKVFNSSGGEVGKYFYDGEGKRVKKVGGSETTIFVYSSGKLIAEYSTQTATTPTISYTTSDHLGSPRVITDATGKVKSRRDFLPFGEEIGVNTQQTPNRASIPQYGASDNVRQKFTGYQKDNETNLDFAEARYYNNQHGRFTAVDPLLASGKNANPQTFNRYVYCLNSPIVMIDANGEFPFYFYIRSFAPFDIFGGIFRGDGNNRRFSSDTSSNTTSRITAYTEFETSQLSGGFKHPTYYGAPTIEISSVTTAIGSMSTADYGWFGQSSSYSEAYVRNGTYDTFGSCTINHSGNDYLDLGFSLSGNNDAFPIGVGDWNLSNDIDITPHIPFAVRPNSDTSIDSNGEGFSIVFDGKGVVTGDAFPAAEAFINDSKGNSVFLGVFSIPNGNTPYNSLPGNAGRPMITIPALTVNTNKDGIFQNVVFEGKTLTLDEWNKRFNTQNPVQQ
jgi:RHS repeat-associated protein